MENLIVTHREKPPKSLGAETSNDTSDTNKLSRHDFPKEFVFGSASSAYQFEGAAKEGNRGLSIWDTFTDREPGAVKDGSNGTMAVNSYHLYKEDVQLIKQVGLQAHRISISWSRVLPGGRLDSGVNKEGIKYYSDLIDELLANDIEPFVTLFHFDVPQALEDEYGGFLSPRIVKDFRDYAELCFWQFGDRVKYWITINEPWSFSNGGYATGTLAPGRGGITSSSHHTVPPSRCSPWRNSQVSRNGNPGTEPYLVAHHLLLAHAAAVDLYRQKFQEYQEGKIGISHVVQWAEPLDDSKDSDVKAALRAFDFNFGWFLEPLTSGEYPQSMRTLVGSRLPKFSAEESEKVKGSYDFMGLNYYSATYVTSSAKPTNEPPSYTTDPQVTYPTERNGIPIGPKGGSDWINVYPEGLYKVLIYIKKTYNIPVIYITENGVDHQNNISQTLSEARVDNERIKYHHDHLIYLLKAINDGVNVKGYFIWSLLDNFEWSEGYTVRFGIIYVDRKNNFLRYPKESAVWFKRLLNRKHPEKLSKRHVEENDGDHLKKKPRK